MLSSRWNPTDFIHLELDGCWAPTPNRKSQRSLEEKVRALSGRCKSHQHHHMWACCHQEEIPCDRGSRLILDQMC